MDEIDCQIVELLAQDGRMSYASIAEHIGMSTGTAHHRVRRLRERGYISSFKADVNWEALGYPFDAFISVRDTESQGLRNLTEKLHAEIPFIVSAKAVTGEFDLLLHVRARSSSHLGEILDDIRRITPGPTRSRVTLTTYISGQTPPLPAD